MVSVTCATAILKLREALGLSGKELGELLGVSYKTISRYENGQRPTSKVLLSLGALAYENDLNALAELFMTARKNSIAARARNLPSSGAAPRVPTQELVFWIQWLEHVSKTLDQIREGLQRGVLEPSSSECEALLNEVIGMADVIRNQMLLYTQHPSAVLSPQAEAFIKKNPIPPDLAHKLSEINRKNREFWDEKQNPSSKKTEK